MSEHAYCMDDCTFQVPAGFRDRTVNALEWQTDDGGKIALVVQREPLPRGEPGVPSADALERYVANQTRGYPLQFAGYHVERDEVSALGSAFEVRRRTFRWRNDAEVLYHHQAFVRLGDSALVLTGAAKALYRDTIDRLLDEVLADLRVRGE